MVGNYILDIHQVSLLVIIHYSTCVTREENGNYGVLGQFYAH